MSTRSSSTREQSGPLDGRVGISSVVAFELRKLQAQRRTLVTLISAALLPLIIVWVLTLQARPPKDTLFGRFIHESGWSIPLLLLGFAGQWLLPLLTSIVAGDIFASEDQHGSWKTILTRSASRTQIFAGKAIVALVFAATAYVILAGSTIMSSYLIVGNQPLVGLTGQTIPGSDAFLLVVQSWVSVLAPLFGFTCLAMLLSVVSRNVAVGIAAPVAIGLIMQLIGALGGLELIRPLLLTSPMETWHGLFASPQFVGPLYTGAGVSFVWCMTCIVIAYFVFARRDYQG